MKRIVAILITLLLGTSAFAQELVDFFDLADEVLNSDLSVIDFKEKHKDLIVEATNGEITLKDIGLSKYNSRVCLSYSSDSEMKMLVAMPEYNSFTKTDKYLYATKCHSYMLERFGVPDKTEEAVAEHPSVIGETIYTWFEENGVVVTGTYSQTTSFGLYMVVITKYPISALTSVQRIFFKTIELGKIVDRSQIALALGSNISAIQVSNTSYGTSYQCIRPLYFGGIEWTVSDFNTVGNKLSKVMFTNISAYNNKSVFERLSLALTQKYGTPQKGENEETWFDGQTIITLQYQYAMSKGGEMKHYVYLSYIDLKLSTKEYEIIQSEL